MKLRTAGCVAYARSRTCPDCGGPKTPTARRCQDCHRAALAERRQQRIEVEEALAAERRLRGRRIRRPARRLPP